MRNAKISRNTNETKIELSLNIDGKGEYKNNTGCGFLNHMLDLFAKHSGFDLFVECSGDTNVDYHHTVEDVGIVLGKALLQCMGDMRGAARYGHIILPMDEVLMLCAVDLGGRSTLVQDVQLASARVGDFDTELVREFMLAFTRNSNATVHFKALANGNTHHEIEAMFKAFARALALAVKLDESRKDVLASTKGVI